MCVVACVVARCTEPPKLWPVRSHGDKEDVEIPDVSWWLLGVGRQRCHTNAAPYSSWSRFCEIRMEALEPLARKAAAELRDRGAL